jgi:xyloglucan-specific endo-beta-1,4-glucanase
MKYTIENIRIWVVYLWIRLKEITIGYNYNYRKDIAIKDSLFLLSSLLPAETSETNGVRIINNKWGVNKLKKGEIYDQALYCKGNRFGWVYSTQRGDRGVIGYPEVLIGQSPWGGETTNEYFPIVIKNIKTLESSYDVTMYVQPKMYNLAYDLWFTKTIESSAKNITHELMIWEDRNVSKPGGKYITTVKLSSGTYKLYHEYMDRESENLGVSGWNYTAFIRMDRRRDGNIDLKEFIAEMLNRGYITETEFLTSVEFGNEVCNASGLTIVNKYNLKIN